MEPSKKQRMSNIELARILCISFITIGHFFAQANYDYTPTYLTHFLACWLRIATNVFIMISCYFSTNSKSTGKKILNIWTTMLFYNIFNLIIGKVCDYHLSALDFATALLPYSRKSPWFGSAYISFLLLLPFLQKITFLPKKTHLRLCVIVAIICPVLSTLSNMTDSYLDHVTWFVACFVFISYFSRTKVATDGINTKKTFFVLLIAVFMYSVIVYLASYTEGIIDKATTTWLEDLKAIPNIIISLLLLIFFLNIKIPQSKLINNIARLVFPVYCLNVDRMWSLFLRTPISKLPLPLLLVSIIVGLFILAAILEIFRRYIFSNLIKTKPFVKLISFIDRFMDLSC